MKGKEKENFIRKRALITKGERNTEENITTNQVVKNVDFLGKLLIVMQGNQN